MNKIKPIVLTWDQVTDFTNMDISIGEGGFGKVYRGIMEGAQVAVKVGEYHNLQDPKLNQWRVSKNYGAKTHFVLPFFNHDLLC